MEFFCTSLRAQGHTQINQLLLSVRHLSMREFCHKFGADTARYLHEKVQMQKRQLPAIKKRLVGFPRDFFLYDVLIFLLIPLDVLTLITRPLITKKQSTKKVIPEMSIMHP